ncbi:zinc-dependent metalloprotease [Leucobacter sp. CSA2]|uniref:Zinc-dependent metalloprotease n=1 Tax=Leucobacter edaphi TaxID=2796472 RepID=A0A934UWI8_9MICO|nr:zinc-dependent metalloprotease [Leucobacter edaphi]MBK0421010.1 zinc-dependent metalloprotease [Leucobacter edaphi]
MSANDDGTGENSRGEDFEELQRILREMLSGGQMPEGGIDPEQFAKAAGIPVDPRALQGLFSTLQGAMQNPSEGIDWSVTRKTAIEVASGDDSHADPAAANRAFPVAALWLDEATELGPTPDAPRTLTRIEWIQQSVDTWIGLAEPVAESVSRALMDALQSQMPEELSSALAGATPMLRSVGGALFAVQLGTIVGKLSGEVVSAGDIGIPLLAGPGREGGALLPGGVSAFADGLDQDSEAVTLYLAVRELAHARLFRHTKWLRLHLLSAIGDYARGISIDTSRIEDLASEIDPSDPSGIQELISNGALIPPKTEAQEAAHARLETMLALIEGWVDVVTADAAKRIPGAEAIAEMVRRRRATGGPAEHAFAALAGLELRPRRLREAAALWRLVADRSDVATRDGLWAHPDLLPSSEELDHPARLLERLGLAGAAPESEVDDFDAALAQLLDGELPPHAGGEDGRSESDGGVGETGEAGGADGAGPDAPSRD